MNLTAKAADTHTL